MSATLKSGHQIERFTGEEEEHLEKIYPVFDDTFLRLQPGGWFFVNQYTKYANKIYDYKFEPTDVVIRSFPKSGTVWVSEIIWAMKNFTKIHTDIIHRSIYARIPPYFMDFLWKNDRSAMGGMLASIYPQIDVNGDFMLQQTKLMDRPRLLRSHVAPELSAPQQLHVPKTVFVLRNPKDVCISYYHFHKLVRSFQFAGDLDQFIDFFIQDKVLFSPFWAYTKSMWANRDHPNMHVIWFEDLKTDTLGQIERLNTFLATKLTHQQLLQVLDFTSFANMKKRDPMYGSFSTEGTNTITNSEGTFFRKGESGGWKKVLTQEQNSKMDAWIQENNKNPHIPFKY